MIITAKLINFRIDSKLIISCTAVCRHLCPSEENPNSQFIMILNLKNLRNVDIYLSIIFWCFILSFMNHGEEVVASIRDSS